MKKDNLLYLKHILEAINNIDDFVKDINDLSDFIKDKKTRDAVLRNFEMIGEAARNLDEEFTNNNTSVEWDKIIGMRNFIIHEYFGVDLEIVWETIKKDLPLFKKEIEKLL